MADPVKAKVELGHSIENLFKYGKMGVELGKKAYDVVKTAAPYVSTALTAASNLF